jgi:phosphate uptake regulator
MKIIERNTQEIGKSLLISLPKPWTKAMGIKKGASLKIAVQDNGRLEIAPEFTKKEAKKDISIDYGKNFQRKFFREYFEGYENITINLSSSSDKKEIHDFLKRFMNIQIIEESRDKIITKCFKINELSAQECLKRMHFLTLNMFDDLLEGKKPSSELRDAATRFYYMLVMQIRRFLDEGKFAEENQISLIRAMDLRMVAEKIQRIAELLAYTGKFNPKELDIGKDVEEFYSKAFNYFILQDFAKSMPLWHESKNISKKTKNPELLSVLRLSREISGLVR